MQLSIPTIHRWTAAIALIAVFLLLPAHTLCAAGIKEGKWLNEWKETKKEFERITGRKKPAEKVWGVFRKSSGMEKALKNMDKAYKKADKKYSRENVDAFGETIAAYRDARTHYTEMIEGAIEAEEDRNSPYVAWLDVLKDDLKAIERNAGAAHQYFLDIRDMDYTKSHFAGIKAKIKEADVYIKKIKATPTAENWNKNSNDWLRGFFTAARSDLFRDVPEIDGETLDELGSRLSRWLRENEVKKKFGQLPGDTSRNVVLDKINELDDMMKAYKDWYNANKSR